MHTAPLVSQDDMMPTRKLMAVAIAGAVIVTAVWMMDQFTGVTMPPEVQAALHTAISVGIAYFVRDRANT